MASTPTRDLQEEFLAATRKSQETVVRAIQTWVETVRAVTPKLPSAHLPLAERLPKLPSVTVPFAGKLPKPEEVVASGYDFAEHLLALQRKFAEDLLDAAVPLMPGNGKSPKAPAAKSEPKAPATATPKAPAPEAAPVARAPKSATKPAPKAAAKPGPKPAAKPAPKPAGAS